MHFGGYVHFGLSSGFMSVAFSDCGGFLGFCDLLKAGL